MDISGIENAAGLSAADKATLKQLVDIHKHVGAKNKRLSDYYESKQPTPSIGIDNIPESIVVPTRCDWAAKAVTSVSERVRMDGFVFEGGYKDESLTKIARENCVDAAFNRHVASELVHGCMFATVNRDQRGGVSVRTHTAETSAAIWDEAAQRIGAGFVLADVRTTSWSPTTPIPTQVNMHLPGRVVVLSRVAASAWVAEPYITPLDRPMMEAFTFRATGGKPFGQSRITPTVMYLVDEVQRTMRYMAVSSALYATPKDLLMGLTEQQFNDMVKSKWATMVTSILMTTRDKDGNVPTYQRLNAASPQPYIDAIAAYGKLFSGATGVPLNSLGIVQDNPSSAEAIAAQREDICVAAEDCIESNRESMRQIALMAMAVANNSGIDGLTDKQRTVMPHFKSPSMSSLAATADAMTKVAGSLDGFAQTDVFLEGMGFDASEVERIRSQIEANGNRAALMQIMGGGGN